MFGRESAASAQREETRRRGRREASLANARHLREENKREGEEKEGAARRAEMR